MKILRTLLCIIALCLSARTASATGWRTGTHRASGSYKCKTGPFYSTTFTVDTLLYVAFRAGHSWYLYLSGDFNGNSSVTLDVTDSYLIEASDNGSVIYNDPQESIYVHRLTTPGVVDYTHDESAPPASIQVLPITVNHPYGQLVIAMYPQGHSDPGNGECAEPVTMTLNVDP